MILISFLGSVFEKLCLFPCHFFTMVFISFLGNLYILNQIPKKRKKKNYFFFFFSFLKFSKLGLNFDKICKK